MKKSLCISLTALLLIIVQGCYIDLPDSVTGNGNVIADDRAVSGFNGLKVSSGIDVYITQGSEEGLTIEADENLHDIIKTDVKGGILNIYSTKGIRMAKAKKVYLDYIDLDEISISSAGDVKGQNLVTAEKLKLSLSSAGDLVLDLHAEEVDVNISSSGNARLSGTTDYLRANLSSAGDLHAFDLVALNGNVSVSSAGDARVHITEKARFRSSSAGDIVYMGKPEILDINTSSAGSVRRK